MSRRVNKRGWIVLVSIPSADGAFCVDIFEEPTGGFGFQHFRSDAEDQGVWTPIDSPRTGFSSATEAAASTVADVNWVANQTTSKQALEDWLGSL